MHIGVAHDVDLRLENSTAATSRSISAIPLAMIVISVPLNCTMHAWVDDAPQGVARDEAESDGEGDDEPLCGGDADAEGTDDD